MGNLRSDAWRRSARHASHQATRLHQGVYGVLYRENAAEADVGIALPLGMAVHPRERFVQRSEQILRVAEVIPLEVDAGTDDAKVVRIVLSRRVFQRLSIRAREWDVPPHKAAAFVIEQALAPKKR